MKNHRSCITIFQAPWRSQCPTRKISLLKCFPWQMEEFPSFHVWFVWASLIESRNTSPSPLVEVTNNKQLPSSFGWTWWKCSLGGRYCWCMHYYCNSWTKAPTPLQTLTSNMPELLQRVFFYCWERWILHTCSDFAPKFDTTTTNLPSATHISTLACVFSLDTAERLGGEPESRVPKGGSPDREDATHLLKTLKEKQFSNFRKKNRNAIEMPLEI